MKVRMELLRAEHLPQVMEWRMRPDITRFMNTDPKLTLEGQNKWFERISNDPSQRNWIVYVNDVPSGVINVTNIDLINKHCSWGYYIANLEARSLKLAMYLEWNLYEYVFDRLNLNKLCNETFVKNSQVIQLHKLCGSKEDGIMRQHICKNGEYFDLSIGSVLASDWQEIRKQAHYEHFDFE
jgi:UDP-4-amino-4,6-dideoxy-N-acetyl-beta-L-altrosamine N-acetyltransferase